MKLSIKFFLINLINLITHSLHVYVRRQSRGILLLLLIFYLHILSTDTRRGLSIPLFFEVNIIISRFNNIVKGGGLLLNFIFYVFGLSPDDGPKLWAETCRGCEKQLNKII